MLNQTPYILFLPTY